MVLYTCKTRSLQKVRQPLQETDIPPYPMAKLSLALSGPYAKSMSRNKYIIAFVDWFSGWPEAFSVPDKTADTVANLLIEEIYPRYGCPLQRMTDNGTENVNNVMRETCSIKFKTLFTHFFSLALYFGDLELHHCQPPQLYVPH